MKCPKCGYVSHDYLSACRKCSVDLLGFKAQMQLHAVQAGNIDLRRVLGGVQPSPTASGEFDMGEALFDSPMLVEAQAEDGFDINLDDDFNFTPSGMSLESLDGFEVSNPEAMSAKQRRSTNTGRPNMEAPETDYATVMMDISGLDNEATPLEPTGNMADAPIDPAASERPIESAEAIVKRPDLPVNDALVKPEFPSAEFGSSAGGTSDLDLTPMEAEHTTREYQLPNDALCGETASPFSPTLPDTFAAEGDDTDDLNHESGELILPSFDADVLAVEVTDERTSSTGSPSDTQETSVFIMPELPGPDAAEKPVNPFTEELSFAIDPLAAPEPPPMEFPSLQTSIRPAPEPDEAALIEEASTSESVQPATEGNAAPRETRRADEQPLPLPVEPAAEPPTVTSPKIRDTTMELDIGDVQLPETLDEVPVFPDLPEQTDALLTPSPDEATIVDEPSPLLSTDHVPADLSITAPEAAQAGEDETDDALDTELLFPDEQPPNKRD